MLSQRTLRLTFQIWLGAWLACASGPAAAQSNTPLREKYRKSSKPNIILIVADDLGYGDLGCYGQKKIKTPNLDQLAAEGIRFTQFYAGSTVCAPSRAVLMTGRHTGHVRIRGNKLVPLAPEDRTVAEVLASVGYKTCAVGKWGLGNEGTTGVPNKKGFQDWFGYLDQVHAHNYYPTSLWRNERTVTIEANLGGKRGDYSHDWFTKVAHNFIRNQEIESFFLYLAYTIPHANNERHKAGQEGMEIPSDEPYTKEPWPKAEKNKAAMITRLDRDVGRIMEQLKRMRLEEQTLILFTSDNGPHKEGGTDPAFFQSSGTLRGIKRDLYEGGIRVPMIARWKGKIPAGKVSEQVWAMWDLLPTLADVAEAKPPENLDGISMVPALLGKKQSAQHPFLYWEFHERGFQQAVRMGPWKAVRLGPDKALELFHLENDPAEKENVAAKQPEEIQRIEGYLKTARTDSPDWPVEAAPKPQPGS